MFDRTNFIAGIIFALIAMFVVNGFMKALDMNKYRDLMENGMAPTLAACVANPEIPYDMDVCPVARRKLMK